MHTKYNKSGLSVLGFPCNQFGAQEPGTNAEIKEFCKSKYEVSFDMFSKVNVNGKDAAPFYKHLTKQAAKPKGPGKVAWNFEKFVIDRQGKVIGRFGPRTKPNDPAVLKLIEGAFGEEKVTAPPVLLTSPAAKPLHRGALCIFTAHPSLC
ncbi:MAG: hypothetical protein CM1200mP2_39060 [Planctomycetaceae bacterium]|nr:MAG: hypothetical protein CM1200mP2_39060 [Planctomycetaceae bacterium]